jgi:hypothetical protein
LSDVLLSDFPPHQNEREAGAMSSPNNVGLEEDAVKDPTGPDQQSRSV